MKIKEFFDHNHIANYMGGSVVMYGKRPIFISEIERAREDKRYRVIYRSLANPNRNAATWYPDKYFDLNPVPLGYVNIPINRTDTVVYAYRIPLRMWKVGLTRRNLRTRSPAKLPRMDDYLPPDVLIPSKELGRTIVGDYPDFDEALARTKKEKALACAFSRRFACTSSDLLYKWYEEPVGTIARDGPQLKDEYFYLREALQEDLHG